MKKLVVFFLVICVYSVYETTYGQGTGDSTQYLLSKKTVLAGFGAPFVEFSSISNEFAVCLGGGGALLINRTVFIGGYFEGTMTNHYRPDLQYVVETDKPKIAFEHGGIWLGYIYKHKKAIHGGFSAKLGWGEIDLKDEGNGNPESDYDYRDRIFSIIPQAELEMNLTEWFKVNIGVGYRIVTGIDAQYDDTGNKVDFYENGDFNSPVGTVTLIFGGNEKKK